MKAVLSLHRKYRESHLSLPSVPGERSYLNVYLTSCLIVPLHVGNDWERTIQLRNVYFYQAFEVLEEGSPRPGSILVACLYFPKELFNRTTCKMRLRIE